MASSVGEGNTQIADEFVSPDQNSDHVQANNASSPSEETSAVRMPQCFMIKTGVRVSKRDLFDSSRGSGKGGTTEAEEEECSESREELTSDATEREGTDPSGNRKSSRKRRRIRRFSPEKYGPAKMKVTSPLVVAVAKRKKRTKKVEGYSIADRPYDKLPNGLPFCCDLCKSPYVCNPISRRHPVIKRSKHMPSPRHKVDPATGKVLILCNACGLAFDRPKRAKKEKVLPSAEDKQKYLEEAKQFAQSLVEDLSDPDAGRLYCPFYKYKACRCMQHFINFGGEPDKRTERASKLLKLLKEAKQLSAMKCYIANEMDEQTKKLKKSKNVGLGNGMKKSKAFEEFVMIQRPYLKEQLKLCERATQRVLIYSNNFLHKKLKTEERHCRAQRVKGKAALGLLPPITQIHKSKCCTDSCVMVALTHGRLLHQWRERAALGQAEARRVLAEMLTPSGGARSNCYKFISWVTGVSLSTIGRVNDQMMRTGGDREPPTHGLKKYWQDNNVRKPPDNTGQQTKTDAVTNVEGNDTTANTSIQPAPLMGDAALNSNGNTQSPSYQMELHRQQLLQLQRQLMDQQTQLQEQQQLVQQQLQQQSYFQQMANNNNVQIFPQIGLVQPTQPQFQVPPTPNLTNQRLIVPTANSIPTTDMSTSQVQAQQLHHQQTAYHQSQIMYTGPTYQQQQQPVQTVQVMIANWDPLSQQGQAMPNQQLQLIQTPQQPLLQQQQFQHLHPHIQASNPCLPTTALQIRQAADHTYSQRQPSVPSQSQLLAPQLQLTVMPPSQQLGVVDVLQPPVLSVASPGVVASIGQSTTPQATSPLQMLASFTAEPYDSNSRPSSASSSRHGWHSPVNTPNMATIIPAPLSTSPFPVSPATTSHPSPVAGYTNIQATLQQIFSMVHFNGGNSNGGGQICGATLTSGTTFSPEASQGKITSPGSITPLLVTSPQNGTDCSPAVDGAINCMVLLQPPNMVVQDSSGHTIAEHGSSTENLEQTQNNTSQLDNDESEIAKERNGLPSENDPHPENSSDTEEDNERETTCPLI